MHIASSISPAKTCSKICIVKFYHGVKTMNVHEFHMFSCISDNGHYNPTNQFIDHQLAMVNLVRIFIISECIHLCLWTRSCSYQMSIQLLTWRPYRFCFLGMYPVLPADLAMLPLMHLSNYSPLPHSSYSH